MPGTNTTTGTERSTEIERFWRHLFGGQRGKLMIWTGERDADGGIDRDTIASEVFDYPGAAKDAALWALDKSEEGREVYFCTHLLTATRRVKSNAAPVRTLWGDLDGVEVPNGERKPTALVESSPGRYHAYWRLNSEVPPDTAEDLNRRLADSIGADPSGFDLTQLLRVPGTVNHKYPGAPVVTLAGLAGSRSYDAAELDRVLPQGGDSRGPHKAQPVGEEIPNGSRNQTLTSIGGTLRRRGLDEAAIYRALLGINAASCKPPLPKEEVTTIAASVSRYEPAGGHSPPSNGPQSGNGGSPCGFELTDLGNADRFVARYGDRVKYCPSLKAFVLWDGKRWAKDECGAVVKLAQEVARSIHHEAATETDKDEQRRISRWAVTSQSRARVEAMLSMAQPHIAVMMDELDADPWQLNCQNGTLDLRTGELRDHDPADLITKLAPVEYDPDAEAPRFERFLSETLVDKGVIRFVQRYTGYSLSGDTRERCIAILYGSGKNGKSTLVELMLDLLGDYADNTDVETVLAKKYQGVGNDVAALKGSRFVSTSEVEKGRRLAEGKVKQLTGRDTVTARFLFCEPFSFKPQFKLWMSTNNKPEIRGTDDAIWDRLRLIPFTQRFTGKAENPNLPAELREELPGVLAWAVRGCLDWQRGGLGEAEKITAATEAYRTEMDTLAAFIDDRCVVHPDAWVRYSDLRKAYESWCADNGEASEGTRLFARQLEERGFERGTITDNVKIRRGIALHSDNDPPGGKDSGPSDGPSNGNSGGERITDQPEDSGAGGYDHGTEPHDNGNSTAEKYRSVIHQNTCKTTHSEEELPLSTDKTTTSEAIESRVERLRKNGTFGNSVIPDPSKDRALQALEHGKGPRKVLEEFRNGAAEIDRLAASVAFFLDRPVSEGPSWKLPTLEALAELEERGGGGA